MKNNKKKENKYKYINKKHIQKRDQEGKGMVHKLRGEENN